MPTLAEPITDREWLIANQSLRMDANSDAFDPLRRAFHRARYEFAARYVRGKIVLDVGCGTGYGTAILARDAKVAAGVDVDHGAVMYALGHYGCNNPELQSGAVRIPRFHFGSAEHLDDVNLGEFDFVVSFETLEHLTDDAAAVAEFHGCLRPDGILIASVPHLWIDADLHHHRRVYDRQRFTNLLRSRFERIELFNQNSGSDWIYNHGQRAGIVPTTDDNVGLAECLIGVAYKE